MNDSQKVLDAKGLDVQDLDEFFRKFAKWALAPSAMFETEQQVAEFTEQRRLLCVKAGVKPRNWSAQSVVTYVNAQHIYFISE